MSRHRSSGSTGHSIENLHHPDDWRLSWVVDFYYPGTRLRFPRRFYRDTDEAGARRFAKKHGIVMPTYVSNKDLRSGEQR